MCTYGRRRGYESRRQGLDKTEIVMISFREVDPTIFGATRARDVMSLTSTMAAKCKVGVEFCYWMYNVLMLMISACTMYDYNQFLGLF